MKNTILLNATRITASGRLIFSVILIVFSVNALFPGEALAAASWFPYGNIEKAQVLKSAEANDLITQRFIDNADKPQVIVEPTVARTMYVTTTAYNSEVAQCDSTPCITADGFNVCKHGIEDVVASNFLKFGTKIRIPEQFGDRVFVVHDRMATRFSNRIDIWMIEKSDAIAYGKRTVKVEILN
jgi:3D (Asp-Asp-Asp) domain-containing protein